MIAWTIYITFAGAVLLLLLPRAFARWIALLATIAGLLWDWSHWFARQLPTSLIHNNCARPVGSRFGHELPPGNRRR